MTTKYISRTLIANRGRRDERAITENEIPSIGSPIVILGDPGLGKTELTKLLECRFGYVRIPGGTFYRNQSPARFSSLATAKLVIDGLDEISSSSGMSAIDEVLKKLSQIGNPSFILSCRSADWQGSTDHHKINLDYGVEPVTLHLQPFTHDDARKFLQSYDRNIDADAVLVELNKRDLSGFYFNPLTLTLVAEVTAAGQGLPKGQAELLGRATELLTSEWNPAHQRSSAAQSGLDDLLDSAGAIFAHLLLSGSTGITDRPREQIPDGYVPIGELNNFVNAPRISASVKTRLFQSPAENLYIPYHRVVAEYLGARWLSKRISNGLSERRVFHALTFANGVPTSLRGLHAWLAHFSPRLATRCIQSDPYGVLRYGEPDHLPLHQARLLLNSLASLANEDPYFRSEDWGKRAITGLARSELKDDIVALIKNPDRHVHLSTLVLEALDGSQLVDVIAPELSAIVENTSAAYVERVHAAEALIGSDVDVNWPAVVASLQTKKSLADRRLALEIIALARGVGFAASQMADAILSYKRLPRRPVEVSVTINAAGDDDDDDEPYVSGMVYGITRKISPTQSGEILDEIVTHIRRLEKPAYWRPGYELSSSIQQLLEKAIEQDRVPSAGRVWSWLRLTKGEQGHSSKRNHPIRDWLMQNPQLRREIQKIAFSEGSSDGGPWMAIVHDLPTVNPGLALTVTDITELLNEVGSKDEIGNFGIELWSALVQSQQSAGGMPEEIRNAADIGRQRHSVLDQQWRNIIAPPKRDWRKEEQERKTDREQKRTRKFGRHRASFLPIKHKIASGEEIGALKQIANAYLGRYSDLNDEAEPDARVREWLGDELTGAALEGFVSALLRTDMPSARQIAETHAEGKEWNVEAILISGIAESARCGKALNAIAPQILEASLAAWWEFPDLNSKRLGEQIGEQLEDLIFSSDRATESFLCSVVEPRIRAGHEHVPGLHRLAHEVRFRSVAGKLALRWLRAYSDANSAVQFELLQIAIQEAQPSDLQALVRERLSGLQNAEIAVQRNWMSAAFLMDFTNCKEALAEFFNGDKDSFWSFREMVRADRHERRALKPTSISQLEFIILIFANKCPPVPHPSSSWGDKHPWNAAEFIRYCINAIGADSTEEASISLSRLVSASCTEAYRDQLKHISAQQLRLRRDTDFLVPTFNAVKQTLSNGLPASIDDLRAMTLDHLNSIQEYVRDSDTDAWEAFWIGKKPKNENTCRHRLLDQLRPQMPTEVSFVPETLMPEGNRADIVVIYHAYGLPIEIKGQWHAKVWDAASVQLIEKYARDWRADDRGIYLVLWFGNVPGKNLPKRPGGLPAPSSPEQLRQMLIDGLPLADRARIDVFILDVSKPVRARQK